MQPTEEQIEYAIRWAKSRGLKPIKDDDSSSWYFCDNLPRQIYNHVCWWSINGRNTERELYICLAIALHNYMKEAQEVYAILGE